MRTLYQSPVVFNAEEHTYSYEGRLLQGITGLIHKHLFPNTYDGVPQHVLDAAAEYGTLIHSTCELFDTIGIEPNNPQVKAYADMIEKNGFKHNSSEYLVSDEKNFASCIDKVYEVDENTFILGDIKTTSKLYKDSVAWQLSIYATFFERQNEGAKVAKLYAIWLPKEKYGKPQLIEVERIPNEEVDRLLECEVNGTMYEPIGGALVAQEGLPLAVQQMRDYVVQVLDDFAEAEARKKDMMAKVGEIMRTNELKHCKLEGAFDFSLSADSQRKTLDVDALKADYPDIDWDKYYKVSNVKGALKVKRL